MTKFCLKIEEWNIFYQQNSLNASKAVSVFSFVVCKEFFLKKRKRRPKDEGLQIFCSLGKMEIGNASIHFRNATSQRLPALLVGVRQTRAFNGLDDHNWTNMSSDDKILFKDRRMKYFLPAKFIERLQSSLSIAKIDNQEI